MIALNKVRQLGRYHRRQRRSVDRTVSASPEEVNGGGSPDGVPLQILEMVVRDAMADLPPYQRQMIELRLEGFTALEIAERTQRCSRTVERILRQFRQRMVGLIRCDDDGS